MNHNKRVVVTGLGMVTPLGNGKEVFFQRLLNGDSGIAPITSFKPGASFPRWSVGTRERASVGTSRLAAEVTDFNPKDFISTRNLRRMDRLSHMAVSSGRMALDDAGLDMGKTDPDRVGIVLGTAFGNTEVAVKFNQTIFTEGPNFVSPILVPNTVMNAAAGHASIELKFRGINSTVNHHEASAETAIAYAAAEIRRGRADVMLTGGAEMLSAFFFEVLTRFKAVSPTDNGPEGARPFDIHRNGPVAGEGAGVLLLESLEHAETRGAVPYCEIAGWGMSAAPCSPTNWPSDAKGPTLAIQKAIASANLVPDQVDCVFASANGGQNPDEIEAEALAAIFGEGKKHPSITSVKGALGESFSSGGIRAAAAAFAIKQQVIPPTLRLTHPIQSLSFVRGEKKQTPIHYGLINGFSSGGTFVSLIIKSI